MSNRKRVPTNNETAVLIASRRRCCICFFLHDRRGRVKGQVAHLNHDRSDCRVENLVWLCFDHHDEFDGSTSQSKNLTEAEVRVYRDKLHALSGPDVKQKALEEARPESPRQSPKTHPESEYNLLRNRFPEWSFTTEPWRYPLWQVGNQPDLFAFKEGNGSDGVCLVERIDLPDGRLVVVFMEMAGNPGNSISNSIEALCFQVSERFSLPLDRVVWIEHFDCFGKGEWLLVEFAERPPLAPFRMPKWTEMTEAHWRSLGLSPRKRLVRDGHHLRSKVRKHFKWPSEALPKRG